MRSPVWWFGTIVGWLGLAAIPLAFGGAWLNQFNAPPCTETFHRLCGEGTSIGWVAGVILALFGLGIAGFGFVIRSFAKPER